MGDVANVGVGGGRCNDDEKGGNVGDKDDAEDGLGGIPLGLPLPGNRLNKVIFIIGVCGDDVNGVGGNGGGSGTCEYRLGDNVAPFSTAEFRLLMSGPFDCDV